MIQDLTALGRRWFEEVWNRRRTETIDCICQGYSVVARWTAAGMHTGAALGLSPTGRAVSFRGITWMIFRDGKMIEGWDAWSQGALVQSLQPGPRP